MSQYPHPSFSPRQRRQAPLPPTSSSQPPRASTSRRIESPVIPFHPIYAPHQTEDGRSSSPRHAPPLNLGGPHGVHHNAPRDRRPRRPQADAPPSHSDLAETCDFSTVKRLHLAVFAEIDRPQDDKNYVWTLFTCSDGDVGDNPRVTLHTISPGAQPGKWEKISWVKNLQNINDGSRLLLCLQLPTTEEAAATLESTLHARKAGPDVPQAPWSQKRWACAFVSWAANSPAPLMKHGISRGQHVATELAQEATDAALAVACNVLEQRMLLRGALFTQWPFDTALQTRTRDLVRAVRGTRTPSP
ncbi:hypothetical protein PsYK624_050430 [Phanerochaete sordida]|uniref:Uncharacterized protein n=1 Tax=Phanerochaete sordida TaxID=48140 RepID=A0A9P3G6Z2_9APHY|nr:hypothetical protein PsYK624_050430 [Phanerochaete sordida]